MMEQAAQPDRQHTLTRRVSMHGVGLHSGAPVALSLQPAPAGHGIRFVRSDLPATRGFVQANWQNVIDTRLCTVLRNNRGVSVSTVEHLLSALVGCGIDNALIVLDGPEVPILDGSAIGWVQPLLDAGRQSQVAPRWWLQVLQPVRVDSGDGWAMLLPASSSRFEISIDFPHAAIGRQHCVFDLQRDDYAEAIAPARTFGFAAQVEAMRAAGRARGGSLDNAILLGDEGVLNPGGLRFANEFARHKL
ncbi:MAG: UDP-3-O-[3-hydroxymyristoyl] N-acetylglucosamine deacetylase, partial [Xanthomonadales bacterium]|nr:UDP-3-O-[3-hydroxymyristoyl] N-acetylglucosamine deacetylase [Xanthomonadales bacterium]